MKKAWLIIIIVLVCVGGFLILARLLTGEDSWICDNGQWVKHGAPSSSKPSKPCGSQNTNTARLNANANTASANANQNLNALNVCDEKEKQIKALISAANYCQQDSDCVLYTEFGCPFACDIFYNKEADLNQINRIDEKVIEYYYDCPLCVYDCMPLPIADDIKCIQGKCVDTRFNN